MPELIQITLTHGQPIYINKDSQFHQDATFSGMIRVVDNISGAIYWINPDHVVWIGPKP